MTKTNAQIAQELYNWTVDKNDSFEHTLFEAISKADAVERSRLKAGFKNEVNIYMQWQKSTNKEAFFRWYGVAFTAQDAKAAMVEEDE